MLIHNLLIFEIILAPHQLAHPVVHLTIFVVSFNWCIWSACVHLIVQSWDEGELCAMYTQDIIAGRSLRQTLKQAVARWSVQSVVSCSNRLTRRRTSFSSSRNSNNSSTRTCNSYALHACMRRIHSTWVLNSSSELITCLPMELFYFTAHEFHFANSSLCATWKHVFRIPVQLMCREHGFIVTRLPAAMYLCATLSSCFYWRRLVHAQKYRISRAMSCR